MPHPQTFDSIVLKSIDVGEADRFLILFTRERGLLAARARAARKTSSKLGGALLPMGHSAIGLVEGSNGFTVTSAACAGRTNIRGVRPFLRAQQGIELLLSLIHGEEPMEEIFDLTLDFLNKCANDENDPVPVFTENFLRLMGLLPNIMALESDADIISICDGIIFEHTKKMLKARKIAEEIAS